MPEQTQNPHDEDPPILLLVDDDEAFCRVLGDALGRRGFKVLIAYDLAGAIDISTKYLPEYAVVDLRIGNESGLDLVNQLVALDEHTRIVVLTGYASVATAVEAIKLGANHYLTKPADANEIVGALRRADGDPTVAVAEKPLSVKRLEWEHLQKILLAHNGNISAAARALKMHRRTLQRKLSKHPVRE